MENNNLLKHIAETGYNVGYSAKLHFASFEMIEKLPRLLSFISLAFGVYALAFAEISTKLTSSTLLVLGLIGIYISHKNSDKNNYEQKGIALTGFFNDLKHLMTEVKTNTKSAQEASETLKNIEKSYNTCCASDHPMFATWFAHYKFFWEQQTAWIEEHRPFSFWRDKIPLSLWFTIFLITMGSVFWFSNITTFICSIPKP